MFYLLSPKISEKCVAYYHFPQLSKIIYLILNKFLYFCGENYLLPTMKHLTDFLSSKKDLFNKCIVIAMILLCFAYFYWLTWCAIRGCNIPPIVSDIKVTVAMCLGMALQYAIGSSKCSKDKDETIKQITNRNLQNENEASK